LPTEANDRSSVPVEGDGVGRIYETCLSNLYVVQLFGQEEEERVRESMAYVSYSQLRNNLASYMDQVCDDRAPLFVTRQNARGVVLMSEEDYEGLMETVHLLKSPANATHLLRSIKEADQGKLTEREIIEPGKASSASGVA
jgi:antitoxin YefM